MDQNKNKRQQNTCERQRQILYLIRKRRRSRRERPRPSRRGEGSARAWQESSAGAVVGGEAVEVVEVVLGEESLELGEQIVEEADDTTPVVPVMAAAAVVELEQRREPMAK